MHYSWTPGRLADSAFSTNEDPLTNRETMPLCKYIYRRDYCYPCPAKQVGFIFKYIAFFYDGKDASRMTYSLRLAGHAIFKLTYLSNHDYKPLYFESDAATVNEIVLKVSQNRSKNKLSSGFGFVDYTLQPYHRPQLVYSNT